jgi:hypothetical protein
MSEIADESVSDTPVLTATIDEETVARHQELADQWCEQGEMLLSVGDRAGAMSAFVEALSSYPAHVESLYLMGRTVQELGGEQAHVKSLYCAALAADPNFAPADTALAHLYRLGVST